MKRDCERFLTSLPEGAYDSHAHDTSRQTSPEVKVEDQHLPTEIASHFQACEECRLQLTAVRRHVHLFDSLRSSDSEASGAPEELASPAFLESVYEQVHDDRTSRRHALLFESLERPMPPAVLASPEFFASIVDRAAAASEARVSQALTEGLIPLELPVADAAAGSSASGTSATGSEAGERHWADSLVDESPHAVTLRSLTQSSTPGWLWSRIRLDVRAHRAEQANRRRRFISRRLVAQAAAAAAVITITALLYARVFHRDDSSNVRPQIQFVRLDRPLDSTPSSIVAGVNWKAGVGSAALSLSSSGIYSGGISSNSIPGFGGGGE